MAIITYPLDNIDYSGEDAALFHCTRSSGISAQEDFTYQLSGGDNRIRVGPGVAWMKINRFRGQVLAMKEETTVDFGLPDQVYPRIDRLVLEYSANRNSTQLLVKKGLPASTPLPPARVTSEAQYELHLLEVRRAPGAVAIKAADVKDLRLDKNHCGIMAESVTQIDLSGIQAQADALIESLRQEIEAVKGNTAFLMKSGGAMTGPLTVLDPSGSNEAASAGWVDSRETFLSVTLSPTAWSGNRQTVAVAAMTADASRTHAMVAPEPGDANFRGYTDSGIRCIAQGDGTLTFQCDGVPSAALKVNVRVTRSGV